MNKVFDIAAAIREKAEFFFEQQGIVPVVCSVSREIYRRLIEQNATVETIGNLIVATYQITGIALGKTELRIVIDESLQGDELCLE